MCGPSIHLLELRTTGKLAETQKQLFFWGSAYRSHEALEEHLQKFIRDVPASGDVLIINNNAMIDHEEVYPWANWRYQNQESINGLFTALRVMMAMGDDMNFSTILCCWQSFKSANRGSRINIRQYAEKLNLLLQDDTVWAKDPTELLRFLGWSDLRILDIKSGWKTASKQKWSLIG
jgi:hypothetical protein